MGNSKNLHYGYIVLGGKDSKFIQYSDIPGTEDCYDVTIAGLRNIRSYENCIVGLGSSNSHFCLESWSEIINCEYCMYSRTISDCFACVGLKKKQYCILNKQYTKDEYSALKKKIITQMGTDYGEFFPIQNSPIPYNHSSAQEHFPLTKEQALARGYSWYDAPPKKYKITITKHQIPDAIEDVQDSIVKEIIECMDCKQAYRVIPMELAFLRQEKLPIPRQCPDCRHKERIAGRASAFITPRKCDCRGKASTNGIYQNFATHFHDSAPCPTEFLTSQRGPIVYCLECLYPEAI